MNSKSADTRRTIATEFMDSFDAGRFLWDSLSKFPEQDPEEKRVADIVVQQVGEFIEKRIDPEEVDETRSFPDGLIEELAERKLFRLRDETEIGGFGLSPYHASRVVERVMAWSMPVGQVLAVSAGVGAGPMRCAMQPPLRKFVEARLAEGALSAFADTDPNGQNNDYKTMTANLSEDGSEWILNGEKLFIAAGPAADLVGVSATATINGVRRAMAFYVDTRDCEGYRVVAQQDLMGTCGLPMGALAFDNVRIPRSHAVFDPSEAGVESMNTLPVLIGLVGLVARILTQAMPALALSRKCLSWSLDFVRRRNVNDRELGAYDLVQRIVATTAAEIHAMDSTLRWALSNPEEEANVWERFVAKNVLTLLGWGIADRTVSLMGTEGYETASSKKRRGAPAIPLQRAFRDVRSTRIGGNIDFRLDELAGRMLLRRHFSGQARARARDDVADLHDERLLPKNRQHLAAADHWLGDLSRLCHSLTERFPDPEKLWEKQQTLLLIGRIATDLFTMCVVLSRASSDGLDATEGQELTDIYCTTALLRVQANWNELHSDDCPDYAGVSAGLLTGAMSVQPPGH